MDHMTSKSNFGIYEPSATGSSKAGGAGNVQQQILDALTILTAPKLIIDDPKKLRDQFAMAALGRISGPTEEIIAKKAYAVADAMMEAREAN